MGRYGIMPSKIFIFETLPRVAINILLIMFLLYIRDLEKSKCTCSENWKRDYIKYFTAFTILLNAVSIFYPNIMNKLFGRLQFVIGILGIVWLVCIFLWVNKLDKEKCKCSEGWERDTIKIYAGAKLLLLLVILAWGSMRILEMRRISHPDFRGRK